MPEQIDTLGDALPREIARVRDEVLPAYLGVGQAGAFGVMLCRQALDLASRAMIEGDLPGMIHAYLRLKGLRALERPAITRSP